MEAPMDFEFTPEQLKFVEEVEAFAQAGEIFLPEACDEIVHFRFGLFVHGEVGCQLG